MQRKKKYIHSHSPAYKIYWDKYLNTENYIYQTLYSMDIPQLVLDSWKTLSLEKSLSQGNVCMTQSHLIAYDCGSI